ncbi:TadE family protein [Streptomyces albidoflavus]|uniref:TadE family protein n=1 Tax=Streptomyces albidoflavus TaxID=1886 RepID=UPI002F90BFCD|nr:pilus assembly protein [Streptomyces albidoflavus]WTD86184.1 pilus assembly protein [Streptomyces albidoflavus]
MPQQPRLRALRRGPDGLAWWREDRGATALDLSMMVPLAFLMLFAIIQGGVYFHGRSVAHHAAQVGADAERVHDAAPGAGQAAAGDFLSRMGGSLTETRVAVASTGDTVSVEVTGRVTNLVPGWDGAVRQRVQAPVEEFQR